MNRADDETRCWSPACALWEAAGGPEGGDLEHWTQAQAKLDGAIDPAPASPPAHDEARGAAAHQAADRTAAR
jgi:hypothetical protein